jgi:hypothetical protein
MSDLVSSVQHAILQYVASKHETHTDADVLRVIRDQASLLYERQLCLDALTQDPLQQLHPFASPWLQSLPSSLSVVDSHRLVSPHDGYCWIDAVIQIKTSAPHFVQISFRYERLPLTNDVPPGIKPGGTHVSYTIEVNQDFEPRQTLLKVDCWAAGQGPSMEPALPLHGWDDDDDEMEQDADMTVEPPTTDKYHVEFEVPLLQQLQQWCGWTAMPTDTVVFLLLTFPFYEHEWDLVGFVLDTVFGDDEDDDGIEFDTEGNLLVVDEEASSSSS